MNENHEIYRAQADAIPADDVARLDGYLAGRAEADELAKARAALAGVKAELRRRETMAPSVKTR